MRATATAARGPGPAPPRRRASLACRPLSALLLVAGMALGGCGTAAASSPGASPQGEEQRLLATVVPQQQAKVDQARRNAAAVRDEAAALRLQQRVLNEYGRGDVAVQLEAEAQRKEEDARTLAHHLADQEAALRAYRDYAARIGAPLDGPGGAQPPAAPSQPSGTGGRPPGGQRGRGGADSATGPAPRTTHTSGGP